MPTHLLDTSVYCQPLRPRPLPEVIARWNAVGDENLCTSVIAEAELIFGIRLKKSQRLTTACRVSGSRFSLLIAIES